MVSKPAYHRGISKNKNKNKKQIVAIEFFKTVIKYGDSSVLADLKIITAILQNSAADNADTSPK
tara:strand:- start:392 stop:583 length:192 start_codon:yes stop_codon:yes gene_type:complete